ncbi:MAG: hypothetical protein IT355_06950 [Gemmatimonadaceae bacterium]|nr:hypothetical protein [Gemmatimonadaceae bacterium]
MMRRMLMIAVCGTIACVADPAAPGGGAPRASSPAVFAGTWRSVTPSLTFIGLSVASTSGQTGVLGVRLAFSGVAWEGGGQIDGDSLVGRLSVSGAPAARSVIVARAPDAQTLRVRFRPDSAASLDLTFVRGN